MDMYIAILGRQPALGMAELEQLYGAGSLSWCSPTAALVETTDFDFNNLGGSLKAGHVSAHITSSSWQDVSKKVIQAYSSAWSDVDYKITLGISVYADNVTPKDVQKTGILLKKKLRESNVSMRLVPNAQAAHNTAVSHHNKLGLSQNKVELLIVKASDGTFYVAESVGAQNITSIAKRDQGRPKRDAFVGMLPPKLARLMVNMSAPLASGVAPSEQLRLLDPFCGTGVVLQEALLSGYAAYGTDLQAKMVDYSQINLEWLTGMYRIREPHYIVREADATSYVWESPIDAVATETYLGQPFSAPPSPSKLREVTGNCNHILEKFLTNLAPQLRPGTPLCVAIPAWRSTDGSFTHLPLLRSLQDLGYTQTTLKHVQAQSLLYHRPDQVVARQLLLLTKS